MATHTLKRLSLADEVCVQVRNEILCGEIWPGDRIKIAELADRFSISHIPIREALGRLESEGWVTTHRQSRTVAASVDLDDLAGLYETRRLFECGLSRLAAQRRTNSDVKAARRALDDLIVVVEDQDGPTFWRCHEDFHLAILAPAVNPWSRRLLTQQWLGSERYVRLFVARFGSVAAAMHDHESLLEAFADGDGEALAGLLAEHLTHTESAVRDGYHALAATRAADAADDGVGRPHGSRA